MSNRKRKLSRAEKKRKVIRELFKPIEFWNDNWLFIRPDIVEKYGVEYVDALIDEFDKLII